MRFSAGGESCPDAVVAKAIEAQPSFGQIRPSRGTWAAPVPDRPWDGRGVARTASTALDSLGRATTHLDARPRKPRRVAATLPSSCPSPCAVRVGARRCRAGRPRSNQRRLLAARRRRTTGRRGAGSTFLSSCQGARPALARPAPPGAGVRARFSRVRDRARQGRNGKAGASAADEPGPKGDVQILAVHAPILMWNLPERTCLYAVRSPRTRSCAPVSSPYFPAVRVATWGCQPDSGRRRPSSPGTATRPNPIRRTNRS